MMKSFPTWFLMSVACMGSSSVWAEAATSVALSSDQFELQAHPVTLQYPHAVRLEQVLLDVQQQDSQSQGLYTYTEGFRLFSADKQGQVDALYKTVKTQLQALLQEGDSIRRTAQQMLTQLDHYQYGYREAVNLDVDAVRLKAELNPLLQGGYTLQLVQRPSAVALFGLAQKQMKFHADYTVADYIQRTRLSHQHHQSYAWVIEPNGHIERVGYAYWNDEETHLSPGSAIFIGFGSSDNEMIQLEKNIATLISMIKGSLL